MFGILSASALGCTETSESINTAAVEKQVKDLNAFEVPTQTVELLSPRITVQGYSICPPKAYTQALPKSSPEGVVTCAWKGDRRSDGSAAVVQMLIAPCPAGENKLSVEAVAADLLIGVKANRSGWTQSDVTFGKIGDREFARQEFTFTEPKLNCNLHGVMFSSASNGKIIQLLTLDAEAHLSELKAGESSLLTFQ